MSLQNAKRDAERKILEIVKAFQKETELRVSQINIRMVPQINRDAEVEATLTAELKAEL